MKWIPWLAHTNPGHPPQDYMLIMDDGDYTTAPFRLSAVGTNRWLLFDQRLGIKQMFHAEYTDAEVAHMVRDAESWWMELNL